MRFHQLLSPSTLFAALALTLLGGRFGSAQPPTVPSEQRVFELRTYSTEPGRLDALQARFRAHTAKLFEKHGIANIGYWTPADEPRSKDTLIYIVAHPSREAAKRNWENFVNDPEWHKARDASEADGPIVTKIESVYLAPTDYSAIR